MSNAAAATSTQASGLSRPVRFFGWAMLAAVAAFLINNILTVGFEWPGAAQALAGGGAYAMLQLALYLAAVVVAAAYVYGRTGGALRPDAERISAFNAWIIRGCFWAVFLVGIVDAAIAFMRIENLLVLFVSEDVAGSLGRAKYVGVNVHMPLIALSFVIAFFTRTLGFIWLALLIVAAELVIVFSRFVFSYEQALMGDLVRYWYAALFLFASAYTLIEEGHVRVDVFYAAMSPRRRGWVNAAGSLLLGLSTCWVIMVIGFDGKQSIINSPVANFEVTQTGSVGMFIKYQMALFLGVFSVTMLIQFVSYFFHAVADIRDEPGRREPAEPAAH